MLEDCKRFRFRLAFPFHVDLETTSPKYLCTSVPKKLVGFPRSPTGRQSARARKWGGLKAPTRLRGLLLTPGAPTGSHPQSRACEALPAPHTLSCDTRVRRHVFPARERYPRAHIWPPPGEKSPGRLTPSSSPLQPASRLCGELPFEVQFIFETFS